MTRWFKEPLIHFLLLGGLIFVVYGAVSERGADQDEIFISRGQQENLINTFSRTWQRPPTPQEYQGLLRDYIRQEIAYREGQTMGLDEDDIVIRRRLRQKLELLAEDVAALVSPTEAELQAYLDDHAETFMLEPRLTLQQIYFSADRRGDSAREDALAMLEALDSGVLNGPVRSLGDPLPLPSKIDNLRVSEIDRVFGGEFTAGIQELETGRWSGPVRSGFGWHLALIEEKVAGRVPQLDEVRHTVQRDWLNERRLETIEGLYQRLAENYTIEIEPLVDEIREKGESL
jgi:hypothetical protein